MKKMNEQETKNNKFFIDCKYEADKYTEKGWEVKEVSFWDYGGPTYLLVKKDKRREN
jgi:hypothetical protein